jgi:hypothetical protein
MLRNVSSAFGNTLVGGSFFYSVLKLFTGLAIAAFIAWKLIVSSVINITNNPATANIHHDIFTR